MAFSCSLTEEGGEEEEASEDEEANETRSSDEVDGRPLKKYKERCMPGTKDLACGKVMKQSARRRLATAMVQLRPAENLMVSFFWGEGAKKEEEAQTPIFLR